MSLRVFDLALANNGCIIFLPAHTTHLLKPPDIAVFKSIKVVWKETVDKLNKKNANKAIDKSAFTKLFKAVVEKGYDSSNAKSGFSNVAFPRSIHQKLINLKSTLTSLFNRT